MTENTQYLEKGDYFPFIRIGGREIHNIVNEKHTLIVNSLQPLQHTNKLREKFNIISRTLKDNVYGIMPDMNDTMLILLLSPNRRIIDIFNDESKLLDFNGLTCKEQYNFPFIKIENALDDELLEEVKKYYFDEQEKGKLIFHKHATKDRAHVHPNAALSKKIDNKLSRSVLPELRKIYYFDAKYREYYKICLYDSVTSGRFHSHRDTPAPYQHRRYAMSLILNDDYEGGELYLPEYDMKIKPKANTAIIFPGISAHQVLPVTKGVRMAVITFFSSNAKEQYKMLSHFYDDKNVQYSNIYPA